MTFCGMNFHRVRKSFFGAFIIFVPLSSALHSAPLQEDGGFRSGDDKKRAELALGDTGPGRNTEKQYQNDGFEVIVRDRHIIFQGLYFDGGKQLRGVYFKETGRIALTQNEKKGDDEVFFAIVDPGRAASLDGFYFGSMKHGVSYGYGVEITKGVSYFSFYSDGNFSGAVLEVSDGGQDGGVWVNYFHVKEGVPFGLGSCISIDSSSFYSCSVENGSVDVVKMLYKWGG